MKMKAINKLLIAICAGGVLTLSSCLEETFPTSGATAEQLAQSSAALNSAMGGVPSYMKTRGVWRSDQATDFAYPAQMIIRDVMGQDMIQTYNNYQHFYSFQQISVAINEDYLLNQIEWYYYNLQVKAANAVIEVVDPENASSEELKSLGQALTYRAFIYLDMARLYEFLPNTVSDPITNLGNDVTGLTVPITDPRNPVDPTNNPRATHQQMFDFILSDLDEAQSYFEANNSREDLTRPNLSVVYGLKARLYMWDENYPKAAEFAKLAQAGYTPLTKEQWNDPANGFNNMTSQNSWMFAISQSKEDDCVQTYSNWTSFMNSEGYMGYGAKYNNPMICDFSLYQQIDDRDFRKLSWKAPEDSPLSGQETFSCPEKAADLIDLASLKFRPGSGELSNTDVMWATAIPLMRVEEMYLIEAEAVAQTSPAEGKQLLETFMQTYRFPQYTCKATAAEDIIDEIFLQKRIELWGEGIICFDFKRLDKSVTRAYEDTNWPETARFNTEGRPAWYNFVMCGYEGELNKACEGWNNPDVGGLFIPVK